MQDLDIKRRNPFRKRLSNNAPHSHGDVDNTRRNGTVGGRGIEALKPDLLSIEHKDKALLRAIVL